MSVDANLNDQELRANAVQAARGDRPFDVLIENAQILDMITGRERLADIGIVGPLIASLHSSDPSCNAEQRLNAEGRWAVPGFIDTHMHVESSMITPAQYASAMVPRGVTTALWDPHELANVSGVEGVNFAADAARTAIMRLLPLAPTCVPSAPDFEFSGGDFGPQTISDLLARDEFHGAAELMTMQQLLNGNSRVKGIVQAGLESGKRVCGHGRGLSGGDLMAYAAAGVETDHELTSAADLLAKLEAGFTIELRGSHEHLLPEFAEALISLGHLPQTVTLCTDDVFPDDLLTKGGLDRIMRMLISHGMPSAWVYRAATLNAASRIGRPDLGLIAPGRRADIVLMSDLDQVRAETVIIDGYTVANTGMLDCAAQTTACSASLMQTVKTKRFTAENFEIKAKGSTASIATLSKPRFPEWGEREVTISNEKLNLPEDMIRMAVTNRYGRNTPTRVAFLENWGTWHGAFATTVSHDSHNLTVFGREPDDMALAANAVRDAQGGIAVASDGKLIAMLPLPIAGLISDKPLEVVATELAAIRTAMDDLVGWKPPFLVFKALFGASLVCNAGPRLSDVGLVDVFEARILESCVLD
ncbi:adenine deaminase [Roseibium algae]|uniref:Adenine deaminase n=1 Tax=Roseibium algae TaxID=3123038 RepID=A0ABU8TF77_9HYPH